MEITVFPEGFLAWPGWRVRCALGRGGIRRDKREGDGATPAGSFPLRRVFFRADRLDPPTTALPTVAIGAGNGWCDDPADRAYNRPVSLPYSGRHERLWREDHLYDLIVVLGYNDEPVVKGAGSAIFLHVASDHFAPTEGCVAIRLADLRTLLGECGTSTRLTVFDPAG